MKLKKSNNSYSGFIFFSFIITLILTSPMDLHAYVDPGIIGMLFQAGFVVLFGFLFAIVTKPFKKIRSLYRKLRRKDEAEPDVSVGNNHKENIVENNTDE